MDYRAMVNPTYITAKTSLFLLAGAGNEDAKGMIEALGTQDDLSRNMSKDNGGKPSIPEAELKAILTGNAAAIEARYEALSRYLHKGGYTNLFDIACGYTPRSIYCAKSDIDYVGVDVPVVAEELEQLAVKIGLSQKHPTYIGADATNAASLSAAANLLHGPVLISCEGLTQYLSADEFEQFLGGVREILVQHGGTWVTSDMGVNYEAFSTACMSSPDAVEMYRSAKKAAMSSSNVYGDGVAFWNAGRKQAFIEMRGFRVEKTPFYDEEEDLATLRDIPENWRSVLKQKLDGSCLWVMTAEEGFRGFQMIEGAKQVENLSIDYTKKDGVLQCRVKGRIDTISAPALLEIFENNYDGTASIMVDAGMLPYIKSALYLYLSRKTGKNFDSTGFRLPGDDIPTSETGNPFAALDIDSAEAPLYSKAATTDFYRLNAGAEESSRVTYIRLSEAQLMQYCKDFDGSPNTFFSVMFARAARRYDPTSEKTISIAVAIDHKAMLGNRDSYRMFANVVELDFPKSRPLDDLMKACTIARGQIMLQAQPENSLWAMKQRKALYAKLGQLPLETKLGIIAKSAGSPRWSISVSYANSQSFGPLDPYIDEFYVLSETGVSDIMCEIACINHSFFLAIGQNFSSDGFVKAFLDELASVGIGYEVRGREPLRLCGLETYATLSHSL